MNLSRKDNTKCMLVFVLAYVPIMCYALYVWMSLPTLPTVWLAYTTASPQSMVPRRVHVDYLGAFIVATTTTSKGIPCNHIPAQQLEILPSRPPCTRKMIGLQ